jgi:hypothetical protein
MTAHHGDVREIEGIVGRLARLGELLFVHGAIIGPDRVSGSSRDGYGDDEVVAFAVVVETSAELGASAVTLLTNGHAYSAAVLLRQIIEVEYLTWLFSHDPEAARAWLNAGEGGWWPAFSPSSIRKKAAGQRNLAEVVAGSLSTDLLVVDRYNYLPPGDDIEAVSLLALTEDDLPGVSIDAGGARGQ